MADAEPFRASANVDQPTGGPLAILPDIPADQVPRHVAMVMDGNGRWAQARGWPRIEGHRRGVQTVRMVSETAVQLRLRAITLYCLSSENWKRPAAELEFLMHLLEQYLIEERRLLIQQGMRLRIIGRRDRLPDRVLRQMNMTLEMCQENQGTELVLAIDYGSRNEMVRAVRSLAEQVRVGKLDSQQIDEQQIAATLDTSGLPDPDLLIRSGGNFRVSNFLLWQISYAEMWVTEKFWPDFTQADFLQAIRDYAHRERRFGGLSPAGAT